MEPTERDLLIRVDQKMSDLIETNTNAHAQYLKWFEETGNKLDKKVSVSAFRWVIGILVTIFLSITGLLHGLKG
jgi:hypothetical protein